MLVSFSVQNYRSFASRQTLSMVASTGIRRKEGVSFASGNSFAPQLLRSACLFGANGAGKSSLVMAVDFFVDFVVSSAKDRQEGEKIDTIPFKLDEAWSRQPTEFEAVFVHGDALYQYGFAVDTERVWGEWLFYRPNAPGTKTRTLFQREYDSEEGRYVWDINKSYVKGEKGLWKKSTRDNALFLSTAIQLKGDAFKKPFEWIQRFLRIIKSPDRLLPGFTASQCVEGDLKDKIVRIMQSVDIKIKDIDVDVKKIDSKVFPMDSIPESERAVFKKAMVGAKSYKVIFHHQGKTGATVLFDLSDESDGSQVVFSVAGPWLDVLENGYTLVVDELHNSLHPHALKFLVNLFHDPKINNSNAQLIFTSHETSVMAKNFMYKDQVWLMEKEDDEQSKLIPLSDYRVRSVSSYQKAYLDGRYGAVPRLKEFVGDQQF